jgi:hypothetical protein
VYDLVDERLEEENPAARRVLVALTAVANECEELSMIAEREFFGPLKLFGWSKIDDGHAWTTGALEEMMGRSLAMFQQANNFLQRCKDVTLNCLQQLSGLFDATQRASALWSNVELRAVVLRLGHMLRGVFTMDKLVRSNELITTAWAAFQRAVLSDGPELCGGDTDKFSAMRAMVLSLDDGVMTGKGFLQLLQQSCDGGSSSTGGVTVAVHANQAMHQNVMSRAFSMAQAAAAAASSEGGGKGDALDLVAAVCVYALIRHVMPPGVKPDSAMFEGLWKTQLAVPLVSLFGSEVSFRADEFLTEYCPIRKWSDCPLSLLCARDDG